MPDRETLDVDVLFVGAGPAGLAGALHLANLSKDLRGAAPQILILEKGAEVGHHLLSGAILDPVALRELVPDFLERGCPIEAEVGEDSFQFLTASGAYGFPFVPPSMGNHGNYVVSICRFARWLAKRTEEAGVQVLTGFPGAELLWEDDRVTGVRTGDKGVDRQGNHKGNFEPGVDVRAKVTVLCEGVRGSLTKKLVARLGLDAGRQPQSYATAVKEVWRIPAGRVPAGRVTHTLGWPLDPRTFGGGFLYGMAENHLALGFVVGCDAEDPATEPHALLQAYKRHPAIAPILDGGERVAYGAKAIPEGGWYAVPRPWADGCLLAGDAAGFVNVPRLKGIHLAMKTGMLAADAIFEALQKNDTTAGQLSGFEQRVRESWVHRELWGVRNFRQAYARGLWRGLFHTGLQMLTGGRGLFDPFPARPGHERTRKKSEFPAPPAAVPAGPLTFDKRTNLFFSGTGHEENQPCHLLVADTDVCRTRCAEEYGNPCERFCPANVYEMVEDRERGGRRLDIHAANCVHCKTCDIMDPYQIITWVPPEGGGGPRYTMM